MSMAKSVTDLLTLRMKNIKMAMGAFTMLNRKDGWTEKRDIMKRFEELVNEIKVLSDKLKNTQNEIETEEENFSKFVVEYFNGKSLREKVEQKKTDDKFKQKKEEHTLAIEHLKNVETFRKLKMKIMQNNARTSLFNETLPTIIEVWNKYEGKRCGEKTFDKIRNEIYEKTNCRIYLTGYNSDIIAINHKDYCFANSYEVKAYLKYDHKMRIDNVIQHITMDDFHTEKKYIENVDIHIHNMLSAYSNAQAKKKELENAYAEFNLMTVDGIENLYIHKDSYSII